MTYTIRSENEPHHQRKLSLQEGAKIYSDIRQKAQALGYLSPTYGYYFLLGLTDILFVVLGFYLVFISSIAITTFLSSIFFAFFFVHFGALTHDFGHQQVFKNTKLNNLFGFIVATLTATPYKVWVNNHNRHHAHTNEQGQDPDIDTFLTFVEDRPDHKTGIKGFIRQNQHLLYYPVTCLAGISFRIKGLYHLLHDYQPKPTIDIVVLALGIVFWWVGPFFYFPIDKALIFVIVSNLAGGFYIANVFAPNHKGMPQLAPGVKYSFLEQQVVTSRNVRDNFIWDYILLGLNYQVEHHLFPGASRYHMANLNKLVAPIYAKLGLPITSLSMLETNKYILKESKQIALAARKEAQQSIN